MSFDLLGLATVAIVIGFVAVLILLVLHPHVDALIRGNWTPEPTDRA